MPGEKTTKNTSKRRLPPPPRVPKPVTLQAKESRPTYRDSLESEYDERPSMSRIPVLRGVFTMLLRNPLPIWWASLSAVSLVLVGLLYLALPFVVWLWPRW